MFITIILPAQSTLSKRKDALMSSPDSTFGVEARIVGQRTPLHAAWQVPLPPSLLHNLAEVSSPFQLCDLIEHVVRYELSMFRLRQEERRLLHVLSPQAISAAAATGKIAMGDPEELRRSEGEIDDETAVITALQAFEDGLYFVFLNGQQQHALNATVELSSTSTLTFIRLVALVGG
jgi:hypothetical protein